ncbi:MAG: EpsG family protein [Lachnospiraceae bacterium]|nr:EpsG family protein [Lachnospiraceae bacterium]
MTGAILYCIIVTVSVILAFRVCGRKDPTASFKDRILTAGIFFLLWIPASLRIYTGNDYRTYISHFHDAYCGNFVVTEPGFNSIVKAIYTLFDGEYFLILFALFSAVTIVFFLKGLYEQSEDFGMSFMLFMMFGLYFQTYNTVRYYMALSVVFYAMRFVIKKQYGKFFIAVLFAALFHKTALITLLLYPACRMKWGRIHYILLGLLGISGLAFGSHYMELFVRLYPSYLNDPEHLVSDGISFVNIARSAASVAAALILVKKSGSEDDAYAFYFRMNAASLVLYACFSFIPSLSRIGYYLNISQILLIPAMLRRSDRKVFENKEKLLRMAVAACAIVYFIFFLYKAQGNTVKILPYSTWLSCPLAELRAFKG